MGEMGRDTGIRYEDVAGIEHVKQDITDTMAMLTNQNLEFEAMGARPPRVSAATAAYRKPEAPAVSQLTVPSVFMSVILTRPLKFMGKVSSHLWPCSSTSNRFKQVATHHAYLP